MKKYYTRACNFFYGSKSKKLLKNKETLPLCGDNLISFNQIEVFIKDKKKVKSKIINIKNISKLPSEIKKKVSRDILKITAKRQFLGKKNHMLMGILNLTPDSFSDGGKFNSLLKAKKRIKSMIKSGADIIDIGGESTRPGSKIISQNNEFKRVKQIIKSFKKKFPKTLLSVDTRKSLIMDFSIKHGADIVNDVSCFKFDSKSFETVKNKNLWKIIHHMQGNPQNMQINPKYNNAILDIYDFFEKEIKKFQKLKYCKKIILDPGIGFGKNLKHNLMILNRISLFHSLGFPVLIGTSRKKFINQISGKYDTKERIGGTLSSISFSFSQGIKIFRVHNVGEVKQGLLVFETLLNQ
ncbi:MAG: dihydropteroate synthase [Candidatus Pelagibacter sp. TMED286]|nr:MAG: dihydropteroate synthase [Candidatus Pelagibacter sp. TMED286]|tara:strand:+ start:1352 stop:2410 length:1059 start_codon:yes stop_codon:yes gene_type:complete